MAFTPTPYLPWPDPLTVDLSTASWYTVWSPVVAKNIAIGQENNAEALAYAADKNLEAMQLPMEQGPLALAALGNLSTSISSLATAINSLGAIMSTNYHSNSVGIIVVAAWKISNTNITLNAGDSYPLVPTLPIGTPAGGVFSVFSGTLPSGVTLDPATGVIAAAIDASATTVSGLVFAYVV